MNQSLQTPSPSPIALIGMLFFLFGFVTWLNGALIPFLKIACELNHMQAYLVTMSFYIAYTVMALPLSVILHRIGFKRGMVLGLGVMALGALGFIPAAYLREYWMFLLALYVLGSGLTILQTAINPYVVAIGPEETAAVRISAMGILNKLAGVVAPLVFTAWILPDPGSFDEAKLAILTGSERQAALSELSARLITPYGILAGLLGLLALFVAWAPLPEPNSGHEAHNLQMGSILQRPQLVLGVIALFFYVGVEVIAADSIGLYGERVGVANFTQLTSYTMAFMLAGYFLGIACIPRFVDQRQALQYSATGGILLSVLILTCDHESMWLWSIALDWTTFDPVPDSVLLVALLGLTNALVWPAIWPLALKDIEPELVSTASALLIMAIAGGAILPILYGALSDGGMGLQGAYVILLPAYTLIWLYARVGCKRRNWRQSQTSSA